MINIVLYQPEKPANTGNIMRTCAATGAKLHIIGPLTYTINDKNLERAGMDYLKDVDYEIYDDYEDFVTRNNNPKVHFITRYGHKTYSDNKYGGDCYIMFGKESTGIPKSIMKQDMDNCFRIPMLKDARSLNLSNCVALVLYEALRQLDYPSLAKSEYLKGENFLDNYEEKKINFKED